MEVNNIDAFLKEVKPTLEKLARRRDTDIGFNAFALISDTYYRENFHSDILAAILNPKGRHGEGALFLDLFRKFLVGVAQRHGQSDLAAELEKLEIDESIEVTRESDGRIDVEIKGPDWVVIVENKINGACDQERQLPRYVDGVEKNGYAVKAIVYLTAAQESEPARIEWKDGDAERVNRLLIPVVGCTEDSRVVDLVTGWLEPCELRSKAFSTRAVLSQYGELVRNQAGETMDEVEARRVLEYIKSSGINYRQFREVLESLPEVLARMIVERCKGMGGIYGAWVQEKTKVVLSLSNVNLPEGIHAEFTVDIECNSSAGSNIRFLVKNPPIIKADGFLHLLQEFDRQFEFDEEDRIFYLPSDAFPVFEDAEGFVSKVEKLVRHLYENRDRLTRITLESM